MEDIRWCDICGEPHHTNNMTSIHCGSWVCNNCIVEKANEIKVNRKDVFETQIVQDKEAGQVYYRITHIPTNSLMAICYLYENAQLICNALNKAVE